MRISGIAFATLLLSDWNALVPAQSHAAGRKSKLKRRKEHVDECEAHYPGVICPGR